MGNSKKSVMTSLMKKFVMAVTGFVLASFLLVHMLGNMQTLEGGPHAINAYANFLQTLPWEILWGFRLCLGACFVLHLLMAYLLVLENTGARPQRYAVKKNITSTVASRTMIYSGTLIAIFAVVHILHYTVISLDPALKNLEWTATAGMYEGKTLHDVYAMLIIAFSNPWVSLGYIAAMVLIACHLSHGVSSMFQSIGFRDEAWRYRLNAIAIVYCVVIAAGFSVNPLAVLVSKYTDCQILPVAQVDKQYAQLKSANVCAPIFINYDFLKEGCKSCKK